MFEDRKEDGRRLGEALKHYEGACALVPAMPRAGVEVGHEVARRLSADFSIVVSLVEKWR